MEVAVAHQIVATIKMTMLVIYGVFRPMTSDNEPNKGWKDVDVRRKEVDSQEAEFEASKYEVIMGCEEAIIVVSKQETKWISIRPVKSRRKRDGETPDR